MELLFSMELSKTSYEETIENFIEDYEMDLNTIDVEYIKNVVKTVTDNVEVIDKKIHFDFNSLIGNLKNIIVFVISVLVSSLKLASRSNSIWNFNICCDKFSRCSTYNSLGINFNNYWNYFWWYFFN